MTASGCLMVLYNKLKYFRLLLYRYFHMCGAVGVKKIGLII
jgi:hypothetical protein